MMASKGFVQHIFEDYLTVLHLGTKSLRIGDRVVEQYGELVTRVGESFIGRVISVTGQPLDGRGPIPAQAAWPVFAQAPMLYKRELLDTQLETGVTVLDSVLPLVRGQRLAIMGESKSGKSALATQIVLNQKNTDVVVVYVFVAKRRSDVDMFITQLKAADALDSGDCRGIDHGRVAGFELPGSLCRLRSGRVLVAAGQPRRSDYL